MFQMERLLKTLLLLSGVIISSCNGTFAQESSQFGPWRMTDYIAPEIIVQTGHPHPVTALAFSPDGNLLASRGQHVAKIWDLRTGKELRELIAKGEGKSIAISPDSQYVTTTSYDDKNWSTRLWNIKTGELVETLSGGNLAKFSPNGRILAIAENGGRITPWGKFKLFDIRERKYIFESEKKEGQNVKAIEFSPNGKYMACQYSNTVDPIVILEITNQRVINRFSIAENNSAGQGWILSIAFSPDSRMLATQHSDKSNYIKLEFRDVYTGKLVYSMIASEKQKNSKKNCKQRSFPETIAFHQNGKMLLHSIENHWCKSQKDYSEIQLIDIEKQKVIRSIRTNNVTSFTLSPDGKIVATGHSRGDIKLWDLGTGKYVKTLQGYAQQITAIDSNPVFPQVASGSFDNTIKIWDLSGKKTVLRSLVGHKDIVVSLDFHPNGKFLVSSELFSDSGYGITYPRNRYNKKKSDRISSQLSRHLNYDLAKGMPNEKGLRSFIRSHNKKVDDYLKTIKKINIWDVESEKVVQTLARSNNTFIQAGGSGWIPSRFQEVRFPKYVMFSSDGRMIAHGVSGGNVHIFNFQTGGELHSFFDAFASPYYENRRRQDRGDISAFIFHPNGHQLIGDDEVWDIATKRKIKKINNFDVRGSRDFVKTGMLAVNKEGSLIAGTCHEGFSVCGAICLASLENYSSSSKLSVQLETGDQYDHINTIVFHPDKNVLAAGYDNGMIILWDTDRQREIVRLQGKGNNPINSLSFSSDGRILYSSSFDAQIQLWDVRHRKKIASLVAVNDKDYVIFTPDNYYMATKTGLRGVAFRIGNEAYPFEQFDAKLNRPDIVMKRIGYAENELTDMYYNYYKKRLRRLNIEEKTLRNDFHIPQLRIVNREALPLVTKDKKIVLDIEAVDFKSIVKRLKVYVNHVPVYGINGIELDKKTQLHKQKIPLELTDGKNKIQVSVLNSNGAESLKETVEIEYIGTPAPSSLYVFSIGVSEYQDSSIENLDYAAKDSKDICSLFEKRVGTFDKVVIKNIINQRAIKENILAIRDVLQNTKVDDEVVLFFAGHGLLHNKTDYYFATYDMNFKSPVQRGLSYEDIESLLYAAPARKKLLLIDTCHAGEVEEDYNIQPHTDELGHPRFRSNSLTQLTPINSGSLMSMQDIFADLQFSSGAMVFTAASGLEKAQENSEWKNGAFTHSILQGVTTGKADLNKDGLIAVSELRNYVVDDVRSLTKEEQVPTMRKENLEFDFPIFQTKTR
ncbi:MAG: caspase family protein [Candidatus Electrothrix aestuarii]|uniref:Caspase family protein n=1 Tax=Candidatus Electrothrix aestuarii TaxID=3062594 RepID=A0AAU8LRW6_9BACT